MPSFAYDDGGGDLPRVVMPSDQNQQCATCHEYDFLGVPIDDAKIAYYDSGGPGSVINSGGQTILYVYKKSLGVSSLMPSNHLQIHKSQQLATGNVSTKLVADKEVNPYFGVTIPIARVETNSKTII